MSERLERLCRDAVEAARLTRARWHIVLRHG